MKKTTSLDLPIRFGLADGSNANLLVDAKGVVIGQLFGLLQGVSIDDARKSPLQANGIRAAELITRATNAYDVMVHALKNIAATAPQKRIANLATAALQAAGEI